MLELFSVMIAMILTNFPIITIYLRMLDYEMTLKCLRRDKMSSDSPNLGIPPDYKFGSRANSTPARFGFNDQGQSINK